MLRTRMCARVCACVCVCMCVESGSAECNNHQRDNLTPKSMRDLVGGMFTPGGTFACCIGAVPALLPADIVDVGFAGNREVCACVS